MFVGHLGAGLLFRKAGRRPGLGTLFVAVLLLDLLLWVFVMLGIETVVVPPGYRSLHYLTFVFPYSHGLAAALGWSAAAAVVTRIASGGPPAGARRASLVVALAVFSHFVLDALVHVPDLPLLGNDSPRLGCGLYTHMSVALGLEIAIAGAGVWLYLRRSGLSRPRAAALVGCIALAAAVTVAGGTIAPPPPTARAAALPGIVAILASAAIGTWVDRGVHVAGGATPTKRTVS